MCHLPFRCVFYKLVLNGCNQWLAKLSMTLFTLDTSDPREGESCSEVCTYSDPSWLSCPDQEALLTLTGHTVSGDQDLDVGSGEISQSGVSWPRSLNQKRATLCCNNWGRWQSYCGDLMFDWAGELLSPCHLPNCHIFVGIFQLVSYSCHRSIMLGELFSHQAVRCQGKMHNVQNSLEFKKRMSIMNEKFKLSKL